MAELSRNELIEQLMRVYGKSRAEAEAMAAIELGEVDGDVVMEPEGSDDEG